MAMFRAGAEYAVRRCADVINAANGGVETLRTVLVEHAEQVDELTSGQAEALQLGAGRLRTIAVAATLDEACRVLNDVLATCLPPRVALNSAAQSPPTGEPPGTCTSTPTTPRGEWRRETPGECSPGFANASISAGEASA